MQRATPGVGSICNGARLRAGETVDPTPAIVEAVQLQ